jgi:CubicO group peptidase (beta-lactamase class C family)
MHGIALGGMNSPFQKRLTATLLAALFCLLASTQVAHARPASEQLDALSSRVSETLKESDTVGFAAVITDGKDIIWSVNHGYLDLQRSHPVTLDTPFRIGSITKTITAIAILQLAEEGRLSLNDPVSKYIDQDQFENAWAKTHPLTIAHLLEHTTGWDDLHFIEYQNYPATMTLEDGLAINPGSRVSRWPPGTLASYSNAGPSIAGRIIEIVSGMTYQRYVQERVLDVAGLKSAGFDLPLGDRLTSFRDSQTPYPFTNLWAESAGGLTMSARDLTRITQALMQDGELLISPESVRRMETPTTSIMARRGVPSGFGPGLETRNRDGHLYHMHSGAIDGYNSQFGYLPTAGLGYVLLSNTADSDAYIDISRAIRAVIEAEAPEVAPRPIAVLSQKDAVEGAYRAASTRNGTFYMLDLLLGAQRLEIRGNSLVLTSYLFGDEQVLEPLGDGLFTDDSGLSASHLVADKNGRFVIMSPDGDGLEKTSSLQALAPIILLAISVFAALFAILASISAALVRLFKPIALKQFLSLWLSPTLAGLSLAAFAIVLLTALNDPIGNMQELGRLSALSGALWVLSFGLPVFAAMGLIYAVRIRSISLWWRGLASALLITQLGFAAMLFTQGWTGFTSWSSNVKPYPVGDFLADLV